MSTVPTVKLNSGYAMPQLGFGVFEVPPAETELVVTQAIEAGYRSIDTAAMYGNEAGVGAALRASGVNRKDLFITTKLNNPDQGYESTLRAFDTSMAALGLDYLDLYLIHWPLPSKDLYTQTWQAFVQLQQDGRVRSIGVSNFHPAHLDRVITETGVTPALNQIELHPYLSQAEVRGYDTAHGIATEAWAPLARGGALLDDPVVQSLARKYGKTPAQVVIRWHLDLGNVVIPKSATPSRIIENFDVFDIELDADDAEALLRLDRDGRTGPDPDTFG